MRLALVLEPPAAGVAPEVGVGIPARLHEAHIVGVRHGMGVDRVGIDVADVRALLVVVCPADLVAAHRELACLERDRRNSPLGSRGPPQVGERVDEVLAHLEGLEHRLVVLVLVLDDHVVGVPAAPQRLVVGEALARQTATDTLAHVVDVRVGVGRLEQAELRSLRPLVLAGVVDVVEPALRGLLSVEGAQEPQLLLVADVRQIPDERREDRGRLSLEIVVRERRERAQRPPPRLVHGGADRVCERAGVNPCRHSRKYHKGHVPSRGAWLHSRP
jgi:hypothetical protein